MPRKRTKSDDDPAIQLNFRVEGSLRKQLDEAAKQHGVSLSKEITSRLENSIGGGLDYVPADRLAHGGFGQYGRIGPLLQLAAETMWLAGMQAAGHSGAENWFDDPYAYDQAIKAAFDILSNPRPDGDPDVPPHAKKAAGYISAEGRALFLKNLHSSIAGSVLETLARGKLGVIGSHRRTRYLFDDLKPLIEERRLKLPELHEQGDEGASS
jgi:hypothetical protein